MIPGRVHYLCEFACSSHVCVGFLQVLGFPRISQQCAREVNWPI